MPTKRCPNVVLALLVIVLAISLFYNAVQSTARARLRYQNQSLVNELKSLRELVQQQLHPSPASVTDIQTGKDILAIPQELHQRRVQITPYDQKLADSGWLVIDLPFSLNSQVPNLEITLYYRDLSGERDQEQAIYPTQSVKDYFNGEKQRLEILVPRHLSSLCRLRLLHESGTSWSFRIEDSKLVFCPN